MSTIQQSQELLVGKGNIAEVVKAPEPLLLVCQKISARLSQYVLWSAIIGCWMYPFLFWKAFNDNH